MALSVSQFFKDAQSADVNKPTYQVFLILGNYASSSAYGSTASSSGDDSSGDYPASGAIDGDRTEINIGPLSGSENGIGKSSWRSSAAPDSGTDVFLEVNFGASRTINRIKLYHLTDRGLDSFKIEYWTGTEWKVIAYTADLPLTTPGSGYGEGGYGDGPYGLGGASNVDADAVTLTSTKRLDTIDFADKTTTKIKLTIYSTEVAGDTANVVEIEAYRRVDVTSRTISVSEDRRRDYKLKNNMAASLSLTFDNTDRFFSPSYTPTAAETTSGFVNSEIAPGIGVVVKMGFAQSSSLSTTSYGSGGYGSGGYGGPTETTNADEVVTRFVGTLDSISIRPSERRAQAQARDGMKALINNVTSTTLKQSISMQDAVKLLLGIANVSPHESSLDSTGIAIPFFFVSDQSVFSAIQTLVEAAGDAQFFFDEAGTATFKMYLADVPQQSVISSQTDWESPSSSNDVDTTSVPGALKKKWFLIDNFDDGNFTSNPTWASTGGAGATVTGGKLFMESPARLALPFTETVGTWRFLMDILGADFGEVFILSNNDNSSGVFNSRTGYAFRLVKLGASQNVQLTRIDGTTSSVLINVIGSFSGERDWRVTRDSSGKFSVYSNQVLLGEATDTTYTTGSYIVLGGNNTGVPAYSIDDIYFSDSTDGTSAFPSSQSTVWDSQIIDQGSGISSEGILEANYTDVTGALSSTAIFSTQTSDDGISFTPLTVATPGSTIPSPAKRYIRFRISVINSSGSSPNLNTAQIFDVTINWFGSAGSTKFHATADFSISHEGTLLDLNQEISDALGGDTSIVNDSEVSSAPLMSDGADSDTQWQGTAGTPPEDISASNPLILAVGTHDFRAVVSGGMDTSRMSGSNPAAVAMTFGTAVGSWSIIIPHPTRPIIRIVITTAGTITDFRLIGKRFASSGTIQTAVSSDAASIARFGRRRQTVSNNFITSDGIAQVIANSLVSNYKNPTSYVPSMGIRPTYSLQLGDRVTLTETNTGLAADFNVVGLRNFVSVSEQSFDVGTEVVLVKI